MLAPTFFLGPAVSPPHFFHSKIATVLQAKYRKIGEMDRTTVTLETSEPFTITRAALNKHIISSADYN